MAKPQWFTGAYTRYKTDTNILTTWLAETAERAGYATSAHADPPILQFTVRQLLDQANYIAGHRPKISVPQGIFTAARRAITVRSKCANWFTKTTMGTENPFIDQQNESHAHFISTLKFIIQTLEPNMSSQSKDASHEAVPANRYELLEFDETRQEQLAAAAEDSDTIPSKSNTTHSRPRPGPHPLEEIVNQVVFTVMDFDSIRQHLRMVWQQHKEGEIDLITASIVTETAFQLLEILEDQSLRPIMDGEKSEPVDHAFALWNSICAAQGVDRRFIQDHPLSGWADVLCYPVLHVMSVLTEPVLLTDRNLDHIHGLLPFPRSWFTMMCSICFDPMWSSVAGHKYLVSDTTTKRLQSLASSPPEKGRKFRPFHRLTSLATAYGVQIIGDIHEILEGQVGMQAKRMRVSMAMQQSIKQTYAQFLRTDAITSEGCESWTVEEQADLCGVKQMTRVVLERPLLIQKFMEERWARYPEGPSKDVHKPDSPYSQNPVLCGLAMLAMSITDQDGSMDSVDVWWAITPVAHLYNALKKNGFLSFEWRTMERTIAVYSEEYIFHGGRPTEMKDCLTKIRLAKGVAAKLPQAGRFDRIVKVKMTRNKRRFRDTQSPVRRALNVWMLPQGTPAKGKSTITGAETPLSEGLLVPLLQRALPSERKTTDTIVDDIPEVAFLKNVQEAVAKEIPSLQLNLLGLNQECIEILMTLRDKFIPTFLEAGFRGYDQMRFSLQHVAEDVLTVHLHQSRDDVLHDTVAVIKEILKVK